jgi:hypothetical protein
MSSLQASHLRYLMADMLGARFDQTGNVEWPIAGDRDVPQHAPPLGRATE